MSTINETGAQPYIEHRTAFCFRELNMMQRVCIGNVSVIDERESCKACCAEEEHDRCEEAQIAMGVVVGEPGCKSANIECDVRSGGAEGDDIERAYMDSLSLLIHARTT